jgi:hypothetical protein
MPLLLLPMPAGAEGRTECLTPSRWGAELVPHLTSQQSADIYTGSTDHATPEQVEEAQKWARFASAAYGGGAKPPKVLNEAE